MPLVQVICIRGLTAYQDMCQRQEQTRSAVTSGAAPSTLFLLEHEATITLGRRAQEAHILADHATLMDAGIRCIKTDRGGDVTYHGPGQLVAYPILDLQQWRPSVNWYIRTLEETVIHLLKQYGIEGERMDKHTGVWTDGAKVAAIGVAVKQWTTWHGLALNVAPTWEHWRMIIPCGIKDRPVTSLARLLAKPPPMEEVQARFIRSFVQSFDCRVRVRQETL